MDGSLQYIFKGDLGIFAAYHISGSVVALGKEPVRHVSQEGGLPQAKAVASAEARPCRRFQKSMFQRPYAHPGGVIHFSEKNTGSLGKQP